MLHFVYVCISLPTLGIVILDILQQLQFSISPGIGADEAYVTGRTKAPGRCCVFKPVSYLVAFGVSVLLELRVFCCFGIYMQRCPLMTVIPVSTL